MKETFKRLLVSVIIALSFVSFSSCGGDDEDDPDYISEGAENYQKFKNWYETLKNTSWILESSYTYRNNGSVTDNTIPIHAYEDEFYDKHLATIMTLSATFTSDKCHNYELYKSTMPGVGAWWIGDDGKLIIRDSYDVGGNPGNISAFEHGLLKRFFPTAGKIEECTSDRLVLVNQYDSWYDKYVFRRVYGYNHDSNNAGNNNGNSSGCEKPEIGLEDFTCTTSSITVKYRIYNQQEAQVTSVKGYYGTSTPSKSVPATVSGSLITIRISSLSKGTTYYIKCTATGKGGTTTSETLRLMTNY